MNKSVTIFWFRRDLRLEDNAALYHALKNNTQVLPIFIFDKNILDKLEDKTDARVHFIHEAIQEIKTSLQKIGSDLLVFYDNPIDVFKLITQQYNLKNVYANTDYEGYATQRDADVQLFLNTLNISFLLYKDQVIFEKNEVTKDDGLPYTVYTPYSKKWKMKWNPFYSKAYPNEKYFQHFVKKESTSLMSLSAIGFSPSNVVFPTKKLNEEIAKKYSQQRDIPSVNGTSKLGVHLRFGTISIRALAKKASMLNETYLNELIWRDFYHQITYHFPHINEGLSFKKQYDAIPWRNAPEDFAKWCNGQTGYAIVDAGMQELNTTGFMHNRVRMIAASFLIKHLLIDWRLGEAYFAKKLLDFDFAANNGGWQWASSSGCDAAPYFRIFNPYLQTKKFDPNMEYIKKWVPEFEDFTKYPKPMVEHEFARKRCLEVYGKALKI
jgi:deoxyribodipyrimidine photo-lyase